MSNEVDIFQQGSTAVAQHKRRDDGFTANIGASNTNKSISIRNNKFRLMVNGKELDASSSDHLDVVIVNASPFVQRMYYPKQYKAGEKMLPPECWTSDSQKPDANVPTPQSKTCMDCPKNVKGSGPGDTKACRFHRFIAVVRADDLQGDIYRIKLPSQSIFGNGTAERRPLHEYTDYVKANGENLMSVVSRMTFDENASATRVGFRAIKQLSDAEYDICMTRSQSEEAKRAITLTVNLKTDEDTGEEFEQKPAAQAIPAASVDNIPEPTVRTTASKPATPPQTPAPTKIDVGDVSLDDLVADWES